MKKIIIILLLIVVACAMAYTAININTSVSTSAITNTNIVASTSGEVVQNTIETKSSSTLKTTNNIKKMNTVILHTNKGDIELELSKDKPNTTSNFTKLVSSGFYSNVRFHRVIPSFMIQAGDPQSKDASLKSIWGTGGPGYKFADELTGRETYPQGTLAMANSGANTNGSQFFIVTAVNAPLPPSYTVFGKVISGMSVALEIEKVARDSSDKPLEDIVIKSAELK